MSSLAIRRVLLAFVGAILGASASAGDCHDNISVTRLRPDTAAYTVTSGLDEAGQFVLRNAGDWAAIWQRIHSRMRPVPPLPEVDFEREMMIVVASGRRRSGGYTIRIDQVWREGDTTIIVVHEEGPAEGFIVPTSMTSPVDVARLPLALDPIEFRIESGTRDCR